MSRSRAVVRGLGATVALALATGSSARAQESEPLAQVHGFGTSSFGKTDQNEYSVGDPEGSYDHGEMSFVVLAHPMDRLSVSTNAALEQSEDGFEAELDYAFAEWRFSDRFRLRAGRVKQPFGLYTEIFDVGTLRPFVTLPEGIYGPAGFVAEGFDGLSLTGRLHGGDRWAFAYDVYGGSIQFGESQARLEEGEEGGLEEAAERVRNLIGARLNAETPVTGLVVGVSGYTGQEDESRHSAAALHLEYLGGAWSVRTELAHVTEDEDVSANAFYVEVARRFGHWQVAVRHDRSDGSEEEDSPPSPDTLRRHRDTSVGLNYWFAPHFVIKVSGHRVDGNRFAHAADEDLPTPRTNMVVVGAQFSF